MAGATLGLFVLAALVLMQRLAGPRLEWALALLGIFLAADLRRVRLALPWSPVTLGLGEDGWWLRLRCGARQRAEQSGAALVWAWLMVLPLRSQGRRFRVVLAPDSATAEQWRRLAVVLRWGGAERSDAV